MKGIIIHQLRLSMLPDSTFSGSLLIAMRQADVQRGLYTLHSVSTRERVKIHTVALAGQGNVLCSRGIEVREGLPAVSWNPAWTSGSVSRSVAEHKMNMPY
jgi:hypothetical protein